MDFCFFAERPLGRLAKWLRLLGFDTLYEQQPGGLIAPNEPERSRIILTRRRNSRAIRPEPHRIFIRSDHYMQQLAELISATGMTLEAVHPFSRCIRCNRPIVPAAKTDLRGKVPDYVFEMHDAFKVCPGCGRIYWQGSHTAHSLERIRRLFHDASNP